MTTFKDFKKKEFQIEDARTVHTAVIGEYFTRTEINDYAETFKMRVDGLDIEGYKKLKRFIKSLNHKGN